MDVDQFIEKVRKHQPILETDLVQLFQMAAEVLYKEGTLISLQTPITVCGDVHGQFYDVLELFNVGGQPPDTKYLFLGDYVDRGYYSVETFSLLLAFKVKYPDRFFMLRGNHECRQVNQMYGFYEEIVSRFGHPGPYKMCNEMFDYLPMAAVIDNALFCVHGGLSPTIRAIEQIAVEERRQEIPSAGTLSDLCWSDPDDIEEWGTNMRGAGYLFGRRPTREFLHNNRLKKMARAHQIAMEGYQYHFGEENLVTVWSAPNYMYRSGNKASVMEVDSNLDLKFKVFDAVPDDQRLIPTDRLPPYFS
ncbi:Serine/threonine-protein phosphatase ppe1 [Tritrichomonas foetus]|uniref:Serine/threonine-protein phosphatase n=1 Tax=Tritrichomonas foetus TaxID=1144522 RepID=A0A1J4KCZ3_9EUKA|nr:Serine/threonine-protein phosphatase ppe1 [Tritrichomonas foetus]|eukprot:OHT07309.1 Serine/threonine-protein phosphatase ppe1 [Tritrichomonas foetus]